MRLYSWTVFTTLHSICNRLISSIRGLFNLTKVQAPPFFAIFQMFKVRNSKFSFFFFFWELPFYKQKLSLSYPTCWYSQLRSRFRAEGSFRRTTKRVYKTFKTQKVTFIIKDLLTWRGLVSKNVSNWHLYIVQNMSRSGSRILDPVFREVGAASPKGKRIGQFSCQSGTIFEWNGFEFVNSAAGSYL
jgi:hypothetical protein